MQTLYSLQKQAVFDDRLPRQRYPQPQPQAKNLQLIQQAGQQLYGVCKLIDQIIQCPGNRMQTLRMTPIHQVREWLRSVATEMILSHARADHTEYDPGEFNHNLWPHQDQSPQGSRRGEGNYGR